MSFPNVGRLVTPEEVVAFVKPMANTIGVLETVVIESAEDMVEDYCQRKFELQTHTDDQYFIRRSSVTFDGITIVPRRELRLRHRPVTTFTALKHVTQYNPSGGLPLNPETVGRDSYHVDFNAGIVIFHAPVQSIGVGDYPLTLVSGYIGTPDIELLATYEAGYAEIPKRLKLAVLMVIARVYNMTVGQNWHRTQTQTTGVQSVWQEFIRQECGLTPEEKLILNRFKTPAAA